MFLSVFIGLGFVALLVNAWYKQVERNAHYLDKSRKQHHQSVKMVAQRGEIHDRNGRELAVSAMVPSVYAIPRKIADPMPLAQRLAGILDMDVAVLHRRPALLQLDGLGELVCVVLEEPTAASGQVNIPVARWRRVQGPVGLWLQQRDAADRISPSFHSTAKV